MKKIGFKIFLLAVIAIIVLFLNFNCNQPSSSGGSSGPSKGRITIRLINADVVADGTLCYFGIYNGGADPEIEDYLEGIKGIPINGGLASATSTTKFPGGKTYDIYGFVDLDANADPLDPIPDPGDMVTQYPTQYHVFIDGNQTVVINYNDLEEFEEE